MSLFTGLRTHGCESFFTRRKQPVTRRKSSVDRARNSGTKGFRPNRLTGDAAFWPTPHSSFGFPPRAGAEGHLYPRGGSVEINTGNTAWLLLSSALVLLMTPGLALFYGGLNRSKGVLNMMMMS